jgi:D-serine deaminase-like pyridoxal phosphate-dependent protein
VDKDGIDTPALLLDLDALESNIDGMREDLAPSGCDIRPHIKVHKTPAVAHKQMKAGSVGVTCAKLGEAEVMASSGIRGILIANQIVGQSKVDRLAGLARHTDVMVAIDNVVNAEEISRAGRECGSTVGVVIEVDVGFKRAGVQPGESVSLLAKKIGHLEHLRLAGIMGYEGHLQGISSLDERTRLVENSIRQLVESARQLRRDGFECEVVSTAGTNTYAIASKIDGVTELQAGSYTVMDSFHSVEGVKFKKALTVLTSVTSTPEPGRAMVDAGLKAFADVAPFPVPKNHPGIHVTELSEEHGHLKTEGPDGGLRLGQRIEFYPFYAPTTMNLYDKVYGMRGDHVEIQ